MRPELGNTNENIHDKEKKIKGVKGNISKKKKRKSHALTGLNGGKCMAFSKYVYHTGQQSPLTASEMDVSYKSAKSQRERFLKTILAFLHNCPFVEIPSHSPKIPK